MSGFYPLQFDSLPMWAQEYGLSAAEARERFAQGAALRVIANSRELTALLVFKGGNALDFVWLPNRSTKDLDFSVLDADAGGDITESRLQALIAAAFTDSAAAVEATFKLQRLRRNPPGPARAFATYQMSIGYALPDQPALIVRLERGLTSPHVVIVEVSVNEIVCGAAPVDVGAANKLRVSTIEDIVAEKLRALLQQPVRNRKRPQDLLDIASILASGLPLDRRLVAEFMARKSEAREVSVSRAAFRAPELIERTRAGYDDLRQSTRVCFIAFDEALAALLAFIDSLDIPE
ncbi:MAG: nucleotidyl transferase AbiEii/AbiGii toxin family protein [Dehalococcoidia bacterium]